MLLRLLIAALLIGHAMIHTGFLAPRPPKTAGGPPWPFELDRSWILDALGLGHEIGRQVGVALVAVTLGGFALAAVAALGIGPAGLWPAAAGVGAVGSLAALLLFFHPWLVLAMAIDLALLWAVLVLGWAPDGLDG